VNILSYCAGKIAARVARIPASLRPSSAAYGAFFKEDPTKLAQPIELRQEIRARDQKGDRDFI
jgi:hypothetical protein